MDSGYVRQFVPSLPPSAWWVCGCAFHSTSSTACSEAVSPTYRVPLGAANSCDWRCRTSRSSLDAGVVVFLVYYTYNVFLSLPCLLDLGGEFRGPMGKFPKQPGSYLLGMCLSAHGDHVHCWLRGCLCKNHARASLHGLLHPRGTGKNAFLRCWFCDHWYFLLSIFCRLCIWACVSALEATDCLSVTVQLRQSQMPWCLFCLFLLCTEFVSLRPRHSVLVRDGHLAQSKPHCLKKGMLTYQVRGSVPHNVIQPLIICKDRAITWPGR